MGNHAKPNGRKTAAVAIGSLATFAAVPFVGVAPAHADAPVPSATVTDPTPPPVADPPPVTPPPAKCDDYVIKSGDTLSGVAWSHAVKLAALEKINPQIIAGDRPDDYSLVYTGGHVHMLDGSCDVVHAAPVADVHRVHHRKHHRWTHHRATPVPSTPPVLTTPAPPPPPPVIAPSCGASANVARWAPTILQAMDLVGMDHGQLCAVEALMTTESSGNPQAINLTDSNAAAGHPSKGLMQTIQSTFDAYHVAGTSTDIYDPLANIAAALNYINHVYGGVVPHSPY